MPARHIKGMLADDLTGAMDAGMQLLGSGLPVRVALTELSQLEGLPENGWVVINTNSRNIPLPDAQAAMRRAWLLLRRRGISLSYKKIDSTLRGNLGGELSALMAAGVKGFIVAPALPAGGRTTLDGIHYVHGRRLLEDELSQDPFAPVQHDRVVDQIALQAPEPAIHIHLKALRDWDSQGLLAAIRESGARIMVFDAQNDEDLRRVAGLCALDHELVPCGSAGLIAALSPLGAKPLPLAGTARGPMLILCGSPALTSKQQLNHAASQGGMLLLLRADPGAMRAHERQALIDQALAGLKAGRHVALDVAADGKASLATGISPQELKCRRDTVQSTLNEAASQALQRGLPGSLMVIGGDSAAGILSALHTTQLELLGAAQPLMPFARCADGMAKGTVLITKAGGFGQLDGISNILEAIAP